MRPEYNKAKKIILDILLCVIIAAFILPAIWVVLTALRPDTEINASPPLWIPKKLSLDKIAVLFGALHQESSIPFTSYLFNSIITALAGSTTAIAVGTLAGYAFARFKQKGLKHIFLGLMLVRAIPGIALGLPLFAIFARLRILDNVYSLALVYAALGIPFIAWLMSGYFKDIPEELDHSAQIDGCSRLKTLLYIDMPLAWPGLAAGWTFIFLTCWNEFQIASILTRTTASKTFPVGLFDFANEYTTDWSGMAAMSLIMLIPAIVFVLLTQRNLVMELTLGSVKG